MRLNAYALPIVCLVGLCIVQAATVPVVRADPPQATPAVSSERVAELIRLLGDNDYYVREQAQKDLAALGYQVFDALTAAENDADLEIATRAAYLLRLIQIKWTHDDDTPEVRLLLKDYEEYGLRERLQVIEQLTSLAKNQGLAPLCRLVKFERSGLLSKRAAQALIELLTPDSPAEQAAVDARRQPVAAEIADSPRPAAAWVRAQLATLDDAAKSAPLWSQVVEAEMTSLDEQPDQSDARVASWLLRRQAGLELQLGHRDRAIAAMRKMITLDEGSNESLPSLLDWLSDNKAWELLDEVQARFEGRFSEDPLLLYSLAAARRAQGNQAGIDQAIARARALHPKDQSIRWRIGYQLQRRGYADWAEQEYRLAIELGEPGKPDTITSQTLLSELLNDQERYLEAAEVLEASSTAMQDNIRKGQIAQNTGREPASIRARVLYFRSCAARTDGNRALQLALLEQALAADANDAEALIALYHMPDLTPERHQKMLEQLKAGIEFFRQQITRDPDEETHYNQFAWLVANTEGDYAEALRSSQRSLEIRPKDPGYLDTLGRCYYAVGDLENAVATQALAVRLDPHTNQIRKQLEVFRAELAKKRGGDSAADPAKPQEDTVKPDEDAAKPDEDSEKSAE